MIKVTQRVALAASTTGSGSLVPQVPLANQALKRTSISSP